MTLNAAPSVSMRHAVAEAARQTFRSFFVNVIHQLAAPAPPAGAAPLRSEVAERLDRLLNDGPPRMGRLAGDLGMSRQTLYRRLKAEGTSFERQLDLVRRRRACRMLSEGVGTKVISEQLGFSEPAAFSRAFKRWTGLSTRAFRLRDSGSRRSPTPSRHRAG